MWEHYCKPQVDIIGTERGHECNWCGATETTKDNYTVSIDSFNNKGYKGDDDFQDWLTTEAPLIDVGVNADPITLTSGYTVTTSETQYKNWQQTMSSKLPIDMMHTLYPKEMKGEYDDDLPF